MCFAYIQLRKKKKVFVKGAPATAFWNPLPHLCQDHACPGLFPKGSKHSRNTNADPNLRDLRLPWSLTLAWGTPWMFFKIHGSFHPTSLSFSFILLDMHPSLIGHTFQAWPLPFSFSLIDISLNSSCMCSSILLSSSQGIHNNVHKSSEYLNRLYFYTWWVIYLQSLSSTNWQMQI